jgi:hypothetical protein
LSCGLQTSIKHGLAEVLVALLVGCKKGLVDPLRFPRPVLAKLQNAHLSLPACPPKLLPFSPLSCLSSTGRSTRCCGTLLQGTASNLLLLSRATDRIQHRVFNRRSFFAQYAHLQATHASAQPFFVFARPCQ